MGTILGGAAPLSLVKPFFCTFKSAAIEIFEQDPKIGPQVISALVDAWGIVPIKLGLKARGLDRGDIAVLARALNKDEAKCLAAFDKLAA